MSPLPREHCPHHNSNSSNRSDPSRNCLDLETTALSATATHLSLPVLVVAANVRLLVLVRAHAKVLDGFARVLGASDQDRVRSGGRTLCELVESQDLTTGGKDASACGLGETESRDGELGNFQQSVVISDGTNNNDGLGAARCLLCDTTRVAGQVDDSRKRHGRSVDLGHKQASQNRLVESRIRSSGQESVELDQEQEVRVLALGGLAVALLDVVLLDIDTLMAYTVSAAASHWQLSEQNPCQPILLK